MATIAFLGTGLLGSAFAEAAAARGDSVSVWNRSAHKAQALARLGVRVAATPAEAVRGASRVHLVLKDDAVVEAVIAAAREGLGADAVLLDHTTTLPERTALRAQVLAQEGLRYLHCPVFMGPAAARKAQGSMLVCGAQALYEQVRSDLQAMTTRVQYLGARGDLAAVNKLLGNAMILGLTAVVADILTLAQAGQVAPQAAMSLLGLLDLNAMLTGRGMNMAQGNFTPSFELTMARKDIGLMLQAAGERPLAVLPQVAARMDQLIAAGHGALDACALGLDAVAGA